MKAWTSAYHDELKRRFDDLRRAIPGRLNQIVDARSVPALDDMAIGSARRVRAAALFFDIEGFTSRTASEDEAEMLKALTMLNHVIPMVMHVVHDHAGYIEKNTGDGVMALFISDGSEQEAVANALDAALTCFYVLREFTNPYLESIGIPAVHARIGIDFGPILISKIGVPTGSAEHPRNFLTAVGPTANIACRLQQQAGRDQIWVGERVRQYTDAARGRIFSAVSPANWIWVYRVSQERYPAWNITELRTTLFLSVFASLLGQIQPAGVAPVRLRPLLLPPRR
jgi:adenylate cyclase